MFDGMDLLISGQSIEYKSEKYVVFGTMGAGYICAKHGEEAPFNLLLIPYGEEVKFVKDEKDK